MLSLEEVKSYLEADQKQIEEYIQNRKLQAFKIGGTYLRFRKDEVLNLRSAVSPSAQAKAKPTATFFSRVSDFWRFNNFYIVSILLIIGLAVYVVKN